ncbi:MAG: radical SAM protein [Candidatus Bathyarchaeota archaeon]|nr:radical SAM protein [Candidatus Bathyarchaeota archaeon]MCX8177389.1 radical SAM protein [Candidatus Bathyarchaeota archaeon]MDW8193836.1 radical SAM protein [Nitrososphaerota archaeon]
MVQMWRLIRPDATAVLNDEMVRKSLSRYFAVMQNAKLAKFMLCKCFPVEFNEESSLDELWKLHEQYTQAFYEFEKEVDSKGKAAFEIVAQRKSYLDLKVAIAKQIMKNCHFCIRRCNINRHEGKLGFCRCGKTITVSSIFEHMGEEPELVPSGTVFTLGCTIRCKHCQNWAISQWLENGEAYSPERLAKEIVLLRESGCRNVNLVGGEPTPWLEQWLETFKHVTLNVPVVWNSNAYYSPETAQLLAGFVDVYLLDFKYGPGDCSKKISEAPNYWEVCTSNHLQAKNYGELIIRVLVLPSHLECCTRPILNWIAENLGREIRVNVMFQYRPEWRAYEIPELRRRLTRSEMEAAIRIARDAGLKNFIT